KLDHELGAHGPDHEGEQHAAHQAEHDDLLARPGLQHVDGDVDADVDAGAHTVGGAELRHPHEDVDAQFLRPGQVDIVDERIKKRDTDHVALYDSDKDQQRRRRDQTRDQSFLETIQNTKKHLRLVRLGTMTWPSRRQFPRLTTAAAPTAAVEY